MKTLEELVKELGLKPSPLENQKGRTGNYVILIGDCQYNTGNDAFASFARQLGRKVIEVKPE